MALTAAECLNAKPGDRPYKLFDSGGLFLYVATTGAKSWRFKYRFGGKEKLLTFGIYPEVKLAEARDRRDEARRVIRDNKDPVVEERKRKAAAIAAAGATFETIARAWHEDEKPRWSVGQAKLVMRALERDIFPALGKLPVANIDGPMVLVELRKIERRGAIETAKRVRGYVAAVFERAIGDHYIEVNPAAKIGKGLKKTPIGSNTIRRRCARSCVSERWRRTIGTRLRRFSKRTKPRWGCRNGVRILRRRRRSSVGLPGSIRHHEPRDRDREWLGR